MKKEERCFSCPNVYLWEAINECVGSDYIYFCKLEQIHKDTGKTFAELLQYIDYNPKI